MGESKEVGRQHNILWTPLCKPVYPVSAERASYECLIEAHYHFLRLHGVGDEWVNGNIYNIVCLLVKLLSVASKGKKVIDY